MGAEERQKKMVKIYRKQTEGPSPYASCEYCPSVCKSVVVGTKPFCQTSGYWNCPSETYGALSTFDFERCWGSGFQITCTYCQLQGVIWKNNAGAVLPNMPIPAQNSEDCQLQCFANSQCLAWTFSLSQFTAKTVFPKAVPYPNSNGYPYTSNCWLRSSWGALVDNCESCVSGSPCGIYGGNNDGPLLLAVASTSPCDCQRQCASHAPGCKAWTYSAKDFVSGNINCWLRSAIGYVEHNCEGCTTGFVCGAAGNNRGAALPGMPIETLYSCECEEKCAENPKCKAWTYSWNHYVAPWQADLHINGIDTGLKTAVASKNCWLRSSDGGAVHNCPSCVSGVKR